MLNVNLKIMLSHFQASNFAIKTRWRERYTGRKRRKKSKRKSCTEREKNEKYRDCFGKI